MIITEHLQMLKANAKNKSQIEKEIKNVLHCKLASITNLMHNFFILS